MLFTQEGKHLSSSLWKNGWLDLDAVWSGGLAGSKDEATRRDWRLPHEKVYKNASLISTTSNIASELSGQAGSRHHCFSCASVASTSFSLCEAGGGHFEHCF